MMATGSIDDTASLWDMSDPAAPHRVGGPLAGHDEVVYSVAFAPDGRTLATGSGDGTVRLWDLTDPARVRALAQPLTGHHEGIVSVVFSPDGQSLASASKDKTALVWDLRELLAIRDHALERACAITGGGLDREGWERLVSGLPYEDTCSPV
jgi:WD40 repeat protein